MKNPYDTIDHHAWDMRRLEYFETNLKPALGEVFALHPWISSAAVCVAQYWDDEAADAVHCRVVLSRLEDPDLRSGLMWEGDDDVNLPDQQGGRLVGDQYSLMFHRPDGTSRLYEDGTGAFGWDDNGEAISLFAAFCSEGSNQCMDPADCYVPWGVVRRGARGLELEVVGTMLRPWLDGIAPEWVDDEPH
jgi:hypothetical protein